MREVLIPTPMTLGKLLLDALVDGLTPLTALGFMYEYEDAGRDKQAAIREDVRKHVVPSERLRIVSDESGKPIAFVAAGTHTTRYGNLYELEGIIIHPDYQGRSLGRSLLVDEFAQTDAKLLGFQTQNQAMLQLGNQVAHMDIPYSRELAPLMGTPNPDLEYLGSAGHFVVHHGRYNGQPLYGDLNKFRANGLAIPGLNFLMGDAVVFVGEIKPIYSTERRRYE